MGRRPDLELARLALPSKIDAPGIQGWEFDGESTLAIPSSSAQLGRQWVRLGSDGYGEMLGQIVRDHEQVLTARYEYWIDDPIRSIKEDYEEPDVIASEMIESSADDIRVYCVGGDVDSCKTWYYWARYGQYIISFLYTGQGMSLDTFTIHVSLVEFNVEKEFSG